MIYKITSFQYETKAINMPDSIYLLKVNNEYNRIMCEICSKLTRKTPGRRQLTSVTPEIIRKPIFWGVRS